MAESPASMPENVYINQAEIALQAQNDLLATVFESSPNVLILVDEDSRVEKINRAGGEFVGSSQEELIGLLGGEVFRCINSFEDTGCGRNPNCGNCPVRTRVTRSFQKGETILNEEGSLTVRKDEQEIHLDFIISTVPVVIADVTKVLITMVDITERKRAEERMRFQAYLLENVSDAIISTDSNFYIQSWNGAAEEIYGWKESEVLGKTVEEVLKSEFQAPLKQILEKFYEKRSWRGEAKQYRKDGTPISVLSSVRLIQDNNGDLIRTIATNRDITERKQAEDALQQSELQNRTILRTAQDGFWLIDPQDGRILDVNDAYCQMSGYTRDEILQMTIADFEAIETPDEILMHASSIFSGGEDSFESEHKRKDGSLFRVEVNVQSLKINGGRNFAFIRDITARKTAEEALRKSEEQYRLLFDEMLSGFALHEIICDKDGKPVDYRFLAVNSAFEALTGLKADDLIGKTVLEVMPQTEIYWIERYGRVALDGGTDQFDGFSASIGKHYEARAFCPEPGKFAVMFHDVTERKKMEEQSKELVERLGLASRAARMGIWDWDIQKDELIWDDQMYALYGINRDDFPSVYEAWLASVHPDDRESSNAISEWARLGEVEYDTEFRVMRPDGSIHFIKAFGQVVRDEAGNPLRMTGVNYDITNRKQAEEALRRSEENLRKAQHLARVGSWSWSIKTNQLVWSDEMYQIFGLDRNTFTPSMKEVIARSVHPDDRALVEEANQIVELDERPTSIEYRVIRPDGSVRTVWAEAGELIFDNQGKPALLTGILQDITERKRTDEELRGLLQEKDILLAEIHHRVKNNMQIISSLLGLQAREIKDERFQAAFEESRSRINSMALVHEQLYRIGEYTQIDFCDYIDQLASTLFNMYLVEPGQIKLEIDAEEVYLDLDKAIPCGLLLNELITNSLKYAFPNGRKGKLWIKLVPDKDKMVLTAGDNGIGIPPDFDFETSETLGLQLVRLLAIHDLQGNISLSRNKGIQFRIEFPVQSGNED